MNRLIGNLTDLQLGLVYAIAVLAAADLLVLVSKHYQQIVATIATGG